jgi:hypothetical protein
LSEIYGGLSSLEADQIADVVMNPWDISNSFQNCMHELFLLRVQISKGFSIAMKHSLGSQNRPPTRTIFVSLYCSPRAIFQFLQDKSLLIVGYFRKTKGGGGPQDSFFDGDGIPSFSTLLDGVGKRITNVDMLTDLLGTHYWAIPELTTTVGSSHRIGNLEATLFTCLSRQSAHSIEIFYDVIHHHLKIRAHVEHKLTLDYVKNARVHAQEAVSEAQGLLGEWEIRDNIHLNGRRVRVYLVERNDNEFSMVGSRRPLSTIVAWDHFTDDKDFIDDGVESFTYNLIYDHSYRDEHCFPFDVDQFDRDAHTVDGSNVRRQVVRSGRRKRSAFTAVESEEMVDDIPGCHRKTQKYIWYSK